MKLRLSLCPEAQLDSSTSVKCTSDVYSVLHYYYINAFYFGVFISKHGFSFLIFILRIL